MNKIKKITGITLLVMSLAIPALAWGPGMGKGNRTGNPGNCENCPANITPEQQEQMQALHKKFQDKTADARNEVMKKQIDLNAEINRDNADLKKAKAIQKDINELQAKITDAHMELMIEAKKINPDMPFGRGGKMGKGMRGMHGGMGPGMRM